jgi:hypothetical protein
VCATYTGWSKKVYVHLFLYCDHQVYRDCIIAVYLPMQYWPRKRIVKWVWLFIRLFKIVQIPLKKKGPIDVSTVLRGREARVAVKLHLTSQLANATSHLTSPEICTQSVSVCSSECSYYMCASVLCKELLLLVRTCIFCHVTWSCKCRQPPDRSDKPLQNAKNINKM